MSLRRRLSPILILLVLVVVFAIAGRQDAAQTFIPGDNVYFTDNLGATGASETRTPMERALLHYLDGAQNSIDAAIYDFNRKSVRDALVAAYSRGVAVRVVTDDETRLFNDSYLPYYLSLEEAGITVKDDERENSIMHDKYFVIDNELVWTGSTNMSDNGFSKNHNNAIVLTGTQIAEVYLHDFDQMWSGKFSVEKTDNSQREFRSSGETVEVLFSPKGNAQDKIIREVEIAQSSISFAIFFFTDEGLRDALISAHKRGVTVRGLWDRLGAESPYSADEALCVAGIPIRTETTIGKMHNKFMVIDADEVSPRVVTGSMNWTTSGDRSNDENTVMLRSAAVAGRYAGEFETMWKYFGAATECATDGAIVDVAQDSADSGNMRIVSILYNPEGDDASGEYVVLQNISDAPQELAGWTLSDESGSTFQFPTYVLAPSATVRIWVHSGSDGTSDLYWGHGGAAVWNNSGDTAFLRDSKGALVATCTYGRGAGEAQCPR